MTEFSLGQAPILFNKFLKHPFINVIRRTEETNTLHPSLATIQEKIEANAYISLFDFSLDMRMLLIDCQNIHSDQNDPDCLATADMTIWFEKHINKVPRSQEEQFSMKIAKYIKKITQIRKAMSLSARSLRFNTEKLPQIETKKMNKIAPQPVVNEIQKLLKNDLDTETQVEIAAVLRKHIPSFEIKESVVIDGSEITLNCADELREVLARHSLLKEQNKSQKTSNHTEETGDNEENEKNKSTIDTSDQGMASSQDVNEDTSMM